MALVMAASAATALPVTVPVLVGALVAGLVLARTPPPRRIGNREVVDALNRDSGAGCVGDRHKCPSEDVFALIFDSAEASVIGSQKRDRSGALSILESQGLTRKQGRGRTVGFVDAGVGRLGSGGCDRVQRKWWWF